jgi:hypothetical protein
LPGCGGTTQQVGHGPGWASLRVMAAVPKVLLCGGLSYQDSGTFPEHPHHCSPSSAHVHGAKHLLPTVSFNLSAHGKVGSHLPHYESKGTWGHAHLLRAAT